MTSPLQFFVEFVEHEIAQQRRKRTTLRRALVRRTDQPVFHHPSVQERPDEFEHSLVRHPFSDAGHQPVMVDSIEELLQIKVYHVLVTLGDVYLRLGYSLMGCPGRNP